MHIGTSFETRPKKCLQYVSSLSICMLTASLDKKVCVWIEFRSVRFSLSTLFTLQLPVMKQSLSQTVRSPYVIYSQTYKRLMIIKATIRAAITWQMLCRGVQRATLYKDGFHLFSVNGCDMCFQYNFAVKWSAQSVQLIHSLCRFRSQLCNWVSLWWAIQLKKQESKSE